jgi:hypothetical protein
VAPGGTGGNGPGCIWNATCSLIRRPALPWVADKRLSSSSRDGEGLSAGGECYAPRPFSRVSGIATSAAAGRVNSRV